MDTLTSLTLAWLAQRTILPHLNLKPPTSSLTTFLLLAMLIKTLLTSTRKLLFLRKAKSLGCSNPPSYPHKDPILGLDLVAPTLKSVKNHTFVSEMRSRFATHGNTHYVLALGRWVLVTCEPENIKCILGTKMEDYPIAGPRLYAALPLLGPDSVFTTNGAKWHHARGMIRPAFVRDQVADLRCFDEHITNLLEVVPRDGSVFDVQALLQAMTMDSSTDFMLGYSTNSLKQPSPEAEKFLEDFEFGSAEGAKRARLGSLAFWIANRGLEAAVGRIRTYLRFYLRRAIEEKKKMMEGAEKKERGYVYLDEVLKMGLSEDHAIDQILSIIVAGRDTTAAAMTSAFYYLARSPDAVEKLRSEVKELEAEVGHDGMPTWEQLKGMKYLNNVIKEGQQFALTQMSFTLYKFFKVFKSIEARDAELPLLIKSNLTASFANGCKIVAVPA